MKDIQQQKYSEDTVTDKYVQQICCQKLFLTAVVLWDVINVISIS